MGSRNEEDDDDDEDEEDEQEVLQYHRPKGRCDFHNV